MKITTSDKINELLEEEERTGEWKSTIITRL